MVLLGLMFEHQIARIKQKMQETLSHPQWRLTPSVRATNDQIAEFECSYGLALPQDYKEFILNVSDSFSFYQGDNEWCFAGLLGFYDENDPNHFYNLVPVPVRWKSFHDIDWIVYWDNLSSHEQVESQLALLIHESPDNTHSLLLLSGLNAGTMWSCHRQTTGEHPIVNVNTGGTSNFIDWFENDLERVLK